MEYRGSKLSISQDPLRSIRVYPVAQAAIPIMNPAVAGGATLISVNARGI
jgi:hypothetical protein